MGNFQFTTAIDPAAADLIKRFYAERIRLEAEHTLTSTTLYEDYCCWCEEQHLRLLALPQFCRLFGLLGVAKARIRGRVRYLGVALVGAEKEPSSDNDAVQMYCRDRLRPDPQSNLTAQMLYEGYLAWADDNQFDPFSLPTFGRGLETLGISKKRVAGRMRFVGIAFRTGNE